MASAEELADFVGEEVVKKVIPRMDVGIGDDRGNHGRIGQVFREEAQEKWNDVRKNFHTDSQLFPTKGRMNVSRELVLDFRSGWYNGVLRLDGLLGSAVNVGAVSDVVLVKDCVEHKEQQRQRDHCHDGGLW